MSVGVRADFGGRIKTALYLQGGASLGAFAAGVVIALAQNPNIDFDHISGTSISGLQGAVTAQTKLKYGREAIENHLLNFWRIAHDYQQNSLPLWYRTAESLHDASRSMLHINEGMRHMLAGMGEFAALPARSIMSAVQFNADYLANAQTQGVSRGYLNEAQRRLSGILGGAAEPWLKAFECFTNPTSLNHMQALFRSAQDSLVDDRRPILKESPIYGLLKFMESRGAGIDFTTLQSSDLFITNATRMKSHDDNPWVKRASDGVCFRRGDITPAALAAGGTLSGLSPYIEINGVLYADGGYSGNPMLGTSDHSEAISILVCSRPLDAFADLQKNWIPDGDERPTVADQKRAHFSRMTRLQWEQYTKTLAGEGIVIQPKTVEPDRRLIEPENDFGSQAIDRRILAGYHAAREMMLANERMRYENDNVARPPRSIMQHGTSARELAIAA